MKKIAYITSGKTGLHRFTYNELIELKRNEIDFILCLSQLNNGSWMPKKEWNVSVASRSKALIQFIKLLFLNFKILRKLLREALKKKVFPYLLIALSIYSDLQKKRISSIHCQMGDKKLYIGYFLKKLMNLPLTVTVHAHELYQREVYDHNDEIKDLFSNCDKVITISEYNTQIIKDKFNVKQENIKVMRLFPQIDYQNKVKDKIKILVVANWVEKKGYKILIEAIRAIKNKNIVVWVIGGPTYSSDSIDLEKMIKEYDVDNKFLILGSLGGPLLDIIFSACDIFCLPSYTQYYPDGQPAEREGIPVALMEAMAWGKPVIATRHAGNPELVENILIEEKNVLELKKAIEYLIENPQKWSEMGKNNKKIIAEKYTKNNVNNLIEIFNNLAI